MAKTKTKLYKIKLTLENTVLEGEGETVLIALRAIEQPLKIFTKGIIDMEYDGKKMTQTWNPVKVRNLFRKVSQPVLAKQFEYLLR